jgi:nucleoside-diphosphate kinase
MASERTLAIVKPDAVAKGASGEILRRIEAKGLRIIALKKVQLTEQLARGFYAVHKERPFYKDLVAFMTSGPVVVAALEGENAVATWRELKAPPGTVRCDFGTDIERNAVHGSDATATAKLEIAYFFDASEILAPVEAL